MAYKIRALDLNDPEEAKKEFMEIGSTAEGSRIMAWKTKPYVLKIKNLHPVAINILKQEALARGGEVAASRDSLISREGAIDVILIAPKSMLRSLIGKLKMQPFGLKKLAEDLSDYVAGLGRKKVFQAGGKQYRLERNFLVMGILNVTPDSFYDGGRFYKPEQAKKRVEAMVEEGADIIDVGGLSTRPGSTPASREEELNRTVPLIKYISGHYDVLVSIDTYRSEVACRAMEAGAAIINDISAFGFDHRMAGVAARNKASVVLMHMLGTPKNMQENPVYGHVMDEVYSFLFERAGTAAASGIDPSAIAIDPGIGFGKTAEHNLQLISRLKEFASMGYPLLLGVSRKSFIEKVLGLPLTERLSPSIAAAVYGYLQGANIFRVHDVGPTRQALEMARAIKGAF